jgi:hypothetical protein
MLISSSLERKIPWITSERLARDFERQLDPLRSSESIVVILSSIEWIISGRASEILETTSEYFTDPAETEC